MWVIINALFYGAVVFARLAEIILEGFHNRRCSPSYRESKGLFSPFRLNVVEKHRGHCLFCVQLCRTTSLVRNSIRVVPIIPIVAARRVFRVPVIEDGT